MEEEGPDAMALSEHSARARTSVAVHGLPAHRAAGCRRKRPAGTVADAHAIRGAEHSSRA